MHTHTHTRDDQGFSFAQVIVTMVIVGILGAAIGFTAFQFIGESRNTVLASNTRVAAEAVQNTLALKPHLMDDVGGTVTTGELNAALLSELSNVAGFTWLNGSAGVGAAGGPGWQFHDDDTVETVRVQAVLKGTAAGASLTVAPTVSWLIGDGDAVRLHLRNEEGAWACALIVLRPNWTAGTSASENAQAEGALRGVWFGSGVDIVEDSVGGADVATGGRHHCSPASAVAVAAEGFGRTSGTTALDPLPANAAAWDIPSHKATTTGADDIAARSLQRTVPPIGEG